MGDFELLLALGIEALGREAYGAALCRELEEQTGRSVSLGAIYKTLERLEAKGWLSAEISRPTAERGGRRRKTYRLRAAGQAALRQSLADIDALRSRTSAGLPEGAA